MRFAWGSAGAFDVVRITDNGLNWGLQLTPLPSGREYAR